MTGSMHAVTYNGERDVADPRPAFVDRHPGTTRARAARLGGGT
jgi:hypothetical protein